LIEPEAVLNPFVKASIQRHQETIYAAWSSRLPLGRKRIRISYSKIKPSTVCTVVSSSLPHLLQRVNELLAELGDEWRN
jgi:uncharacterized protein with HEPN domain